MSKIYFYRHGKTFANEKKIYCGQTETELISKGEEINFPQADIVYLFVGSSALCSLHGFCKI